MRRVLLGILLCACGGDSDGQSHPGPDHAPSLPVEAEAAPEHETGPTTEELPVEGGAPRLQLVGADRSHVLFLDTGQEPWTVERLDAAPVVPLHAVTFLGCGAMAAARTTRAVGVFERGGSLVAQRPLPNLVAALGARLTAEVERIDEDYESAPSPASVIDVGPLVRTDAGGLAMNPTFSMEPFHGEMDGCIGPNESLQVALAIDGIEPAPCARPTTEALSLTHALEEAPPSGFECVYLTVHDPLPSPSWLPLPVADVLRALPTEAELCNADAAPEDPWERLAQCTRAGESGGVTICKHDGDPRVFAAMLPAEEMGCSPEPWLYVLRGRRVVAHTGWDGELSVIGDLWIYGGRRAWYVDGPGREPLRFGRAKPDLVLGSPVMGSPVVGPR